MSEKPKKDINASVDYDLAEIFYKQVEERGNKIKRSVEGAIRCWINLTPTEQDLWIKNVVK